MGAGRRSTSGTSRLSGLRSAPSHGSRIVLWGSGMNKVLLSKRIDPNKRADPMARRRRARGSRHPRLDPWEQPAYLSRTGLHLCCGRLDPRVSKIEEPTRIVTGAANPSQPQPLRRGGDCCESTDSWCTRPVLGVKRARVARTLVLAVVAVAAQSVFRLCRME